MASESLATFSDLLRYQLYECNENEIELERELQFLDDFIQLEKLRLDEQHTDLQFEIKNQAWYWLKKCKTPTRFALSQTL